MALYSPHVRRALTSLSTLRRSLSVVAASPGISTPALQSPLLQGPKCAPSQPWALLIKSRSFRTTAAVTLLSARSSYNSNSTEEIGPDTILFEGCDYNHWLIVMDFPKDNKPSPEQMVQTYEETCAKGLNISVEEAKQKMYACSTTTYTGFQAVMTEKESEKFQGLPGVIFVLPDSYIDPVNKEYGGDKYINGIIIPRPPPIQYGRQGRSRDRRYNREGPPMNQGAGDGMNRGAPQNYQSQQNYAPRGPQNYPSQQNYAPGAPQNYPSQQYYAPGAPQNHPSQQNFPPGAPQNYPSRQNYGPPGQGERRDPMLMNQDFGPGGMGVNQLGRGDPIPSHQGNFNSRGQGNYPAQQQRDFRQGDQSPYTPHAQGNFGGASRNYGPPQDGTFGRGASGYQGQGTYGASGPGASSGYGQRPGEDQRFSQEE